MNGDFRADVGRRLAFHGAALFLATMAYGAVITGILTGLLSGRAEVGLATHVVGFLGALWVWGVGWSIPYGTFSDKQLKLVYWGSIVPAWVNFLSGAVKAHTNAGGVSFSGDMANDAIFAARLLGVVLPGLVGAAVLTWGLRKPSS